MFGILGPNGAGKTSTIRMIYGFSPLSGGSLQIFGLDVTDWRQPREDRIGVCQQENNLDPDLSVLQNLEVFAPYFDIPRQTPRQGPWLCWNSSHWTNSERTSIPELPAGMMRRLVLARALINEPDLLILDEPTTGLDPQSRHQVWERLEELGRRGISILLTTHYMEEAARLCDRLIIMDHGRILVEGEPARSRPASTSASDVIEVAEPGPRTCARSSRDAQAGARGPRPPSDHLLRRAGPALPGDRRALLPRRLHPADGHPGGRVPEADGQGTAGMNRTATPDIIFAVSRASGSATWTVYRRTWKISFLPPLLEPLLYLVAFGLG